MGYNREFKFLLIKDRNHQYKRGIEENQFNWEILEEMKNKTCEHH